MTYKLPEATRERIEDAIRQRDALQRDMAATVALINAVLATAREALGVPEDYIIENLDAGFVPPGVADAGVVEED